VGSDPYKFVIASVLPALGRVWRNPDYLSRTDGPPAGTAGPKIAYFDRVEWHTIPDPGDRRRRLQSGRDGLVGTADDGPAAAVTQEPRQTVDIIDTLGYQAVLRFNHLYPPFDNAGSPCPVGGVQPGRYDAGSGRR